MRANWVAAFLVSPIVTVLPNGPRPADSLREVSADRERLASERHDRRLAKKEVIALADRCFLIAEKEEDSDEAIDALAEVLRTVSHSREGAGEEVEARYCEALDDLTDRFVDRPRLAQVVYEASAPYWLEPELEAFLEEVGSRSKHPGVRGAIAVRAAEELLREDEMNRLDDAGAAELSAQLARIEREFAAVPHPSRKSIRNSGDPNGRAETLGEYARRTRWAIDHLRPGMPVPEISGRDLDGTEFKLSDYRGKVVLLDFWGFW